MKVLMTARSLLLPFRDALQLVAILLSLMEEKSWTFVLDIHAASVRSKHSDNRSDKEVYSVKSSGLFGKSPLNLLSGDRQY